MLSHYQMKEIPYLRILGRTNGSLEPVTLFWTASGIELNVKATEIWVKIRSDYDVFEPWVDVIVDGVLSQRLMVNKGEQEICLFRNMERDKVRNVKLLRDTPAFPTDEKCRAVDRQPHDVIVAPFDARTPQRRVPLDGIGSRLVVGLRRAHIGAQVVLRDGREMDNGCLDSGGG